MTVKQTRCPFCQSAFYVTSLQLNAYRGQARCGQCHQVFDAKSNMLGLSTADTPVKAEAPPAPDTLQPEKAIVAEPAPAELEAEVVSNKPTDDSSSAATPEEAAINAPGTEDQAVFSDETGLPDETPADHAAHVVEAAPDSPGVKISSNTISPSSSADSAPSTTISAPLSKPLASPSLESVAVSEEDTEEQLLFCDENGLPDDEAPAEVPMPVKTDSADSTSHEVRIVLDDTFDQQFLEDTFEPLDALKQQELSQVEKLHAAADESWLEDLLAEDEPAAISPDSEELTPLSEADNLSLPLPNDFSSDSWTSGTKASESLDQEEDLLSFLNRTGAVSIPASQMTKAQITTHSRPASHRILQPTPVKYNVTHFIGWSLMSLLMVGLLAAQYIYFNFESLATHPKTAKTIHQICIIAGCQIPYMNEDELHISHLKLIAHNARGQTTFRGQLSNSAKLSQPFPTLRLNLQRNGKTVASQIIQPRQYLPNNLKTLTRLATKTPYPVEFTIKTRRSDIKDFSLEPIYH